MITNTSYKIRPLEWKQDLNPKRYYVPVGSGGHGLFDIEFHPETEWTKPRYRVNSELLKHRYEDFKTLEEAKTCCEIQYQKYIAETYLEEIT